MHPGNLWEKRSSGTTGEHRDLNSRDGNTQVGQALSKARQERGLTHEDVERATKIRTRYLQALERDDYDALPGAVYAQGFVKTYANYLELDGEALSREIRSRRADPVESYLEKYAASDIEENEDPGYDRDAPRTREVRLPRRLRLSPIAVIGAVLGLLLLAIVVAGLYFVGLRASGPSDESPPNQSQQQAGAEGSGSPEADDSQPAGGDPSSGGAQDEVEPDASAPQDAVEPSGEEEAADEPVPAEPAQAEPAPAEPAPAEPPPPESLTMDLRVDGNISWLNIMADGNLVFEGVGRPGFARTFEAEDSITVWSGNAGAVFISLNGQDYGQFGESGEIKVQDFNLKTAEN